MGRGLATAPTFAWPERLRKANDSIRGHARKRDADANGRELRTVSGWSLSIHPELLASHKAATEKAVVLLAAMLDEIVQKVPGPAVAALQKVPLYFSPQYPGTGGRAEYHPGADWLRDNQRDPAMVKAIELTDILDFEAESRRMPNFALHELAHAYHDRVLGFDDPAILRAYQNAKASGTYNRVERRDAEGRSFTDRAYAMTDHKEYFAETTEAFFSRNDFFPFTRAELQQHDPAMFQVLDQVWSRK